MVNSKVTAEVKAENGNMVKQIRNKGETSPSSGNPEHSQMSQWVSEEENWARTV